MRLWRRFLYLSCCIMGKGAIMSQTHSTSGVWTQNTAGWRGRYDHDFPMRGNKYTVAPSCRATHSAMNEWLLFSTNSAISQAILWPEQVNFNEMTKRSALYQTNTFSWIFIVLLTETTVHELTCLPTWTHYCDSTNTNFITFDLTRSLQQRRRSFCYEKVAL